MKKLIVCAAFIAAMGMISTVNAQEVKKATKTEQCAKKCCERKDCPKDAKCAKINCKDVAKCDKKECPKEAKCNKKEMKKACCPAKKETAKK